MNDSSQELPPLIGSLRGRREVGVYVPDVSLKDAMKNEPFVMRVDMPRTYEFLDVIQIEDPMNAVMPMQGRTQLAYAFMYDPEQELSQRFYLTSVLSDIAFPWHVLKAEIPVYCKYLGISTHNGAVVTHVKTHVSQNNYDAFEKELTSLGYLLVKGKKYDRSAALSNLYKTKSAEMNEDANEKTTEGAPE